MRALWRVYPLAAIFILVSTAVVGCGGADDQDGTGGVTSTTAQTQTTTMESDQDEPQAGTTSIASNTPTTSTAGVAQAETDVSGMPDGFPTDVPVHPGTVTAYDPMEVTETTTVHQLTVDSTASFDNVIAWYESQLPAGWSVGFLEQEGESGNREGKIALTDGDYSAASPDGRGGGVIIGVFEGDTTQIVTTVTVMAP
ncbi:MAG: hypothetical protein JW990_06095 [Thermoleophilia bacterium]|nr:hypothetical protein [Thermoleophilia bacterium]